MHRRVAQRAVALGMATCRRGSSVGVQQYQRASSTPSMVFTRQHSSRLDPLKQQIYVQGSTLQAWDGNSRESQTAKYTNRRYHLLGSRVVKEGSRAAVWDSSGKLDIVKGPKRLVLVRSEAADLTQFAASAKQYLKVTFLDGSVRHIEGPNSLWFDPLLHESITVHKCVEISTNESIVVYRAPAHASLEDAKADASLPGIERKVITGPLLYTPSEKEFMHYFSWHGYEHGDVRGEKNANALQFAKIRHVPDQMYANVEAVRTKDDALLESLMMVFFEMVDIEHMLDSTHDPIVDLHNAMASDVISFAASRSFDDFKADSPKLNDLDYFPQLQARAERIGFRINKVVFRGFGTGDNLEAVQNNAITTRTQTRLEYETEVKRQETESYKLQCEEERERRRMKLALERKLHELELRELEAKNERDVLKPQLDLQHEDRERRLAADIARLEKEQAAKAKYLATLQDMGVGLTDVLVAEASPGKRVVELQNGSGPRKAGAAGSAVTPHVHLDMS